MNEKSDYRTVIDSMKVQVYVVYLASQENEDVVRVTRGVTQ